MSVESHKVSPLRVAVDLTPFLTGGANGGVKPFIMEQLRWLIAQTLHPLHFVFLTRESSHAEVEELARDEDELICLVRDWGKEADQHGFRPRRGLIEYEEFRVLEECNAHLFYAPFGWVRHYLPGLPVISLIVDLLHRDYPYSLSSSDVELREGIFQECVLVTDRFQCISDETAEALCRHFAVERQRTFRTHIVIHGRLAEQLEGTTRRRSSRPYFLYPANAWTHKNHHTFLIGYANYLQSSGEGAWDLVLTGHEDDAMREVLETAATLGIAGRIQYEGHLGIRDFAQMWRGAGALVFPSLHEGFGIPLLEAMQMRLPILCGNHATLREVAGEACLAIDVRKPLEIARALEQMAGDASKRADLVALGEQRLEAFDLDRECRTLLEAMAEVSGTESRARLRGVRSDGRLERFAALRIPAGELITMKCRMRVGERAHRCRVYCGGVLFAEWRLPSRELVTREVTWFPTVGRIILEILPVGPASLNENDRVVLEKATWEKGGVSDMVFEMEVHPG